MQRFELEVEARHLSRELTLRGVSDTSLVHAVVEVRDGGDLPLAAIAQAGGAFDWLADEPELYTQTDLRPGR